LPVSEEGIVGNLRHLLGSAAVLICATACGGGLENGGELRVHAERLLDGPIISPATDPSIGENIQGPSLIRVPEWVENPLGRYYLYFADHKGAYIRLAYADDLLGPWRVHVPGSLQLGESHFPTEPPAVPEGGRERVYARYRAAGMDPESLPHDPVFEMTAPHIASPDVHVDDVNRRIIMYYHGLSGFGVQESRVAVSEDGVDFIAREEVLGRTYMRAFRWQDRVYALAMPGIFYRSADGLSGFEAGPTLFNPNMRHNAVLVRGYELLVFWTQVGDVPERILLSRIDLREPWEAWQTSEPIEVLRPEREWEGADAPLEPSVRSVAYGRVNQLRDPAIFEEDGRTYLLYAVAGESGIGIAEVTFGIDPGEWPP
jgi:hypothetical protein